MAKKYCGNCGHGNVGLGLSRCAKCGNPFAATASQIKPKPQKTVEKSKLLSSRKAPEPQYEEDEEIDTNFTDNIDFSEDLANMDGGPDKKSRYNYIPKIGDVQTGKPRKQVNRPRPAQKIDKKEAVAQMLQKQMTSRKQNISPKDVE